ncbi:phospholipase D family protein [Thalassobacillus hwangdonensis]|uniref:phospholipase D n=1 Tax=Thalassobacillus hwangdonensis TaxID=546108 RepID=A0ABW3KXV0_9BACI
MGRIRRFFKKKKVWVLIAFMIYLGVVIAYHTAFKPLPDGISYEGEVHELNDIEFFYDLTYENAAGEHVQERQVFQELYRTIGEAEEFIVADMFLFNGYTDGKYNFPEISENLTNAIIAQKEKHPDLKAVFITDPVNTVYHSYESKAIDRLRDNGVDVVITDLNELRDSNPLYSSLWRTFIQWFGQEGDGWIANPFAKNAPDVTLRSYMKLMNIKANHRKVLVTEDAAIVQTANPHNASGFHENVSFKVTGPIIKDILEAEKAVVDYSGEADFPDIDELEFEETSGPLKAQFLTEGKIYDGVIETLENVKEEDTVWLGMYYLADRTVIELLKDAAKRGATVNIVMDPNKTAFGHEKTGLPNLPVASELNDLDSENMNLRWYDVNIEQFHTKLLYVDKPEEDVIIGGSANYTNRNLDDLNLEADVKITGPSEEEVFQEVNAYFNRIWSNEDGHYTADYHEYQDNLTFLRNATYRIQKLFWFTTY